MCAWQTGLQKLFRLLTPALSACAQAQAAYELATSAFSYGKQRLVCDGFTRKCRAQGDGNRQLGRKAG